MRLSDKEKLTILVTVLQGRLPGTVPYQGRDYSLTERDKMAAGRAIWYIVMLGYSCSSACERALQKFRIGKKSAIERAVKIAMPDGYLMGLEAAKRKVFMEKLRQPEGEQNEASN